MCCSYRHGDAYHADGAETYPADMTRYCKCLGINDGHTDNPADEGKCCGAASGPDGLCDRCRKTCNQRAKDTQVDHSTDVQAGPGREQAIPVSVVLTGV